MAEVEIAGLSIAEEGDYCGELEPFFFDEEQTKAEFAVAEERRRAKEREEQLRAEKIRAHWAIQESLREFEPKQGRAVFTRYFNAPDYTLFDLDEESPLAPMRYTDKTFPEIDIDNAGNILSISIISSDVGFPITIYGSVIARDDLDKKCVPLFRRSRDDCQIVTYKDMSLTLTGPKRGLVLYDFIYIEIDLKIKDDKGDRQLSKGLLMLDGIRRNKFSVLKSENATLDSRLSTVQVTHSFVRRAVEATIAVQVLKGRNFYGHIKACTTTISDNIVLHDSRLMCGVTADGNGIIKLLRRVMAVSLREMLLITINAKDGSHYHRRTIDFTPSVNGCEEAQITCGSIVMLVKVTWSIMHR